jgi:hypothetical protein
MATAGAARGLVLHIARETHNADALAAALKVAGAYAHFPLADVYAARMQFLCDDAMVTEAGGVFEALEKGGSVARETAAKVDSNIAPARLVVYGEAHGMVSCARGGAARWRRGYRRGSRSSPSTIGTRRPV